MGKRLVGVCNDEPWSMGQASVSRHVQVRQSEMRYEAGSKLTRIMSNPLGVAGRTPSCLPWMNFISGWYAWEKVTTDFVWLHRTCHTAPSLLSWCLYSVVSGMVQVALWQTRIGNGETNGTE